jgi:predicted ribosome quality control (RQC) complex YloA/Tae2 family protein
VSEEATSPPSGRLPYRSFRVAGWDVLVGKGAAANDELTFRVAKPGDLWLHASGFAGSHVIIRIPAGAELPREVIERAAQLAAYHSKAREASGKVAVHVCRVADVRKPPRAPAGQVQLKRYDVVRVYVPREAELESDAPPPGDQDAGVRGA